MLVLLTGMLSCFVVKLLWVFMAALRCSPVLHLPGGLCLMPGQDPSFPQAGRFPLCLWASPQLWRKMESWSSGQESENRKVKSPLCTAVMTGTLSTLLQYKGEIIPAFTAPPGPVTGDILLLCPATSCKNNCKVRSERSWESSNGLTRAPLPQLSSCFAQKCICLIISMQSPCF